MNYLQPGSSMPRAKDSKIQLDDDLRDSIEHALKTGNYCITSYEKSGEGLLANEKLAVQVFGTPGHDIPYNCLLTLWTP